eukprot:SAG11_NODE_196_length_12778_cov_6.887767_13_plen_205_part_00
MHHPTDLPVRRGAAGRARARAVYKKHRPKRITVVFALPLLTISRAPPRALPRRPNSLEKQHEDLFFHYSLRPRRRRMRSSGRGGIHGGSDHCGREHFCWKRGFLFAVPWWSRSMRCPHRHRLWQRPPHDPDRLSGRYKYDRRRSYSSGTRVTPQRHVHVQLSPAGLRRRQDHWHPAFLGGAGACSGSALLFPWQFNQVRQCTAH